MDKLNLIFLPLMIKSTDKNKSAVKAVELAKEIKDEEKRLFCIGALIGISDKFIDKEYVKRLKEVLKMTRVGAELREEGREEGIKEGIKNNQDMIIDSIESKYNIVDADIIKKIREIEDFDELNIIMRKIIKYKSLQELKKFLKLK